MKYACFKYNCYILERNRARNLTFKKKADESVINTQEIIDKNIRELKLAKKHKAKKKEIEGLLGLIDLEVVSKSTLPSCIEIAMKKKSYHRNLTID